MAEGVEEVGTVMLDYYWGLFTSQPGDDSEVIAFLSSLVTPLENEVLERPKPMPESMKDLRPIALCNVLYKVAAKVCANWMKPLLENIIAKAQSAFVPGRLITDNIMLAFEVHHYLKRKTQGCDGVAALKIDMSKAYDRFEWRFLRAVMLRLDFSDKWVNIIMETVSGVKYHILHEQRQLGPIVPGRGLRQGDPLSPYMFLMVVEGLSALIDDRMRRNAAWSAGSKGAPVISHLLFADDCFLFMRADTVESINMKDVLDVYAEASGQVVNFDKSMVCFSSNTSQAGKNAVMNTLGVRQGDTTERYLGLPSLVGRNKKSILGFVKDRVLARVRGWNTREIEVILNQYWWTGKVVGNNGIRWKAWSALCRPKSKGGLGYMTLREMNLALLGKQAWRLLTRPNSLVARVYKSRYYPRLSFMEAGVGHNPSYIWRSIVEANNAIKQWYRRSIGDGRTTSIGEAPWLVMAEDPYVTTHLHETVRVAPVSSLMNGAETGWDRACVLDLFNVRDASYILNMPVPARVKVFAWQFANSILPTREALAAKRVACMVVFHMCGGADETDSHLFRDCLHARAVWIAVQLPTLTHGQEMQVFDEVCSLIRTKSHGRRCVTGIIGGGCRRMLQGTGGISTGMGDVDVETDSQLCINALNSDSFFTAFGFLVDDVKHVVSLLNGVSFRYARRSANRAAHVLAREAVSVSGPGEWLEEPPSYLVLIVASDLMN
ncbi:PREDICTED: uncharacterized protein LOC109155342 [Ipomoea nil]|uniref:uncharacterized protein LOC109155342 n=1 Tax=Ipomoea nil TaxID=35883 RepID=UPI000901B3EE|nr:PREDICTED: uncharacterized protein LOC109155342 [Ipomoea nil]